MTLTQNTPLLYPTSPDSLLVSQALTLQASPFMGVDQRTTRWALKTYSTPSRKSLRALSCPADQKNLSTAPFFSPTANASRSVGGSNNSSFNSSATPAAPARRQHAHLPSAVAAATSDDRYLTVSHVQTLRAPEQESPPVVVGTSTTDGRCGENQDNLRVLSSRVDLLMNNCNGKACVESALVDVNSVSIQLDVQPATAGSRAPAVPGPMPAKDESARIRVEAQTLPLNRDNAITTSTAGHNTAAAPPAGSHNCYVSTTDEDILPVAPTTTASSAGVPVPVGTGYTGVVTSSSIAAAVGSTAGSDVLTSRRRKRQQKSVSFCLVLQVYLIPQAREYSASEQQSMWWSRDQLSAMREKDRARLAASGRTRTKKVTSVARRAAMPSDAMPSAVARRLRFVKICPCPTCRVACYN